MKTNPFKLVPPEPVDEEAARQARIATWLGIGIPARREASHGRSGIKLIINHAHVARVLRVKQEAEDRIDEEDPPHAI